MDIIICSWCCLAVGSNMIIKICILSCWNLRLSESRVKLAWAMPSVSNLDEVKTGNWIPRDFQVPRHVAVPRLSDAIESFFLFPCFFNPRENYKSLNKRRLKDGKLNSRGFSNPWNTSRFNYRTVWKTGNWIPRDFQVPGHVAVPRLSTPFYSSFLFPRT